MDKAAVSGPMKIYCLERKAAPSILPEISLKRNLYKAKKTYYPEAHVYHMLLIYFLLFPY
jgi:hypothetical protein